MKKINKVKFIRSSIITIGLIIFIILMLTNISFSHTEIIYKEIAISSGDTLWNIAKYEKNNNAYFEDKDVRDIVAEIKYINNLNSCNLSIGDKLTIPTIEQSDEVALCFCRFEFQNEVIKSQRQ